MKLAHRFGYLLIKPAMNNVMKHTFPRAAFQRLVNWLPAIATRSLSKKREGYQIARLPIQSEEFVRRVKLIASESSPEEMLIIDRNCLGDMCSISPVVLQPEDLTSDIEPLMGLLGFDLTEFIQRIEEKADIRIDDHLTGARVPVFNTLGMHQQLAVWISRTANWIQANAMRNRQ